MKLQDKFKKTFISTLFCGVLVSILFTIVVIMLFTDNFSDKELIERIIKSNEDKTISLIYTTNNMLFKKFQKSIYCLQMLKKYYFFYTNNFLQENLKFDGEVIQKYSINAVELSENYHNIIAKISGDSDRDERFDSGNMEKNSTYLDFSFWFLDSQTKTFDNLDNPFKNQLNILSHMNPIFRSFYETLENNESNKVDLIYMVGEKTKLFYGYPIYSDNSDYYKFYEKFTNEESCKNEKGEIPESFYFPCRPWWKDIMNSISEYGLDFSKGNEIIISNPYKSVGIQKYVVTVCIKFLDPLIQTYDNDPKKQLNAFCMDLDTTDLMTVYDKFNNELGGYFYVIPAGSEVPLYYPQIIKADYYFTLSRFEFDMETNYFVDELADFNSRVIKQLTAKFPYSTSENSIGLTNQFYKLYKEQYKGEYLKNGDYYNYTIFPVRFFTDTNDNEYNAHLLSIIYVQQPSSYEIQMARLRMLIYPRLIIQVFIFFIIASILLLISWYFIIGIAYNIVKPITNIKNLIQNMNMGKNDSGYNVNSVKNENQIFEESEDIQQIRSIEMDKLFDILLKLKNVLSFTKNSKTIYDKSSLINYVAAKYTFSEVSNVKGISICDSNVGNLSIKCRKYDKAIFHLIESIIIARESKNKTILASSKTIAKVKVEDFSTLNDYINNWRKAFLNINRYSRQSRYIPVVENHEEDQLEKKERFGKKNKKFLFKNKKNENKETKKCIYLESRYPKLIYAYKKFFKNLKKLIKHGLNKKNYINDVIDSKNNDFYVLKEKHSLESYEYYLYKYLANSMKNGDNVKIAESILEFIEFLLAYKLKNTERIIKSENVIKKKEEKKNEEIKLTHSVYTSETEKTMNEQSDEMLKNKKRTLEVIVMYFREFDIIYENLKRVTPEYYKNFLDKMKNNKKELEVIDTPFLILFQKANYLKGKFAKYCGHLDRALEFFHKSRDITIICDASIIKKSIKQIIKIMHYLQNCTYDEIDELPYRDITSILKDPLYTLEIIPKKTKDPTNNANKIISERINYLKENAKAIDKYILNLKENLSYFVYNPKDFLVLIDISDSMKNDDSKKIEKSIKASLTFFENFITHLDRFGLFLYSDILINVISLTEKNKNTCIYIKDMINSLLNDKNLTEFQENSNFKPVDSSTPTSANASANKDLHLCKSSTIKAIFLAYDYLKKKNFDNVQREKWIVFHR